MSRFFNVAMLQLSSDSSTEDLDARTKAQLAKIDRHIEAVLSVNPVVDLIVLPETAASGYDRGHWDALPKRYPALRATTSARRPPGWASGSVPVRSSKEMPATGRTRNTALLISPAGEIALKYSKVFIPYPFEESERGDAFPVYDIPGRGRWAS